MAIETDVSFLVWVAKYSFDGFLMFLLSVFSCDMYSTEISLKQPALSQNGFTTQENCGIIIGNCSAHTTYLSTMTIGK